MSNYKKYGLTKEQYEDMKKVNGGNCWICGRPPKPSKSLCIDHSHRTGRPRGLLCYLCNFRLIGRMGDAENAIELFEKAVQYLKNARDNPIDAQYIKKRRKRKPRRK